MKKVYGLLLLVCGITLFLSSCGESGPKPVEIESLETHTNTSYGFSIKYPKNWVKGESVNRFVSTSISEAASRFLKFDPLGAPAAKVEIGVISIDDSLNSMANIIERQRKFDDPSIYSTPKKVMLDGTEATSFTYAFELNDGLFEGEVYIAAKDSGTATIVSFEAFAGTMEKYRTNFDEIIKSIKLASTPSKPVADTVNQTAEAEGPSDKLKMAQGEGYMISIPENFRAEKGNASNAKSAKMFIGDRRGDSYIQVIVSDASKQKDLKKIVEKTAKSIGTGKMTEIKIGGQPGYFVEYNATPKVKRKIYYTKKGDDLYQIVVDYFAAEEVSYKPIFDKCVATFKFN